MNSLGVWTLVIILYQTMGCAVVSWLTLSCRLAPRAGELAELTLLKLVYLYEPRACAAPALYNYTVRSGTGAPVAALVWPAHSPPAAAFRCKLQVWLGLHIAWLAFAAVHAAQRRRPCALCGAALPACCAGAALLLADLVFAALFIRDIRHTSTERDIFEYIESGGGGVRWLSGRRRGGWPSSARPLPDTSWVGALLAYASCRGLVQWLVNFWILKDNYLEGLATYLVQSLRSENEGDFYFRDEEIEDTLLLVEVKCKVKKFNKQGDILLKLGRI